MTEQARAPIVTVAPWFNPEYYAYHWVGLQSVFGAANVRFGAKPFPKAEDTAFHQTRDTFAFVADDVRYFISANDHRDLPAGALEWADVIGAVNLSSTASPMTSRAIVRPIGPSFGVRAWSAPAAMALVARFARYRRPRCMTIRALEATLRRQRRRLRVEDYSTSAPAAGDRVWYLGTYWDRHPEANDDRVTFLRAARAILGTGAVQGGIVDRGGNLPSTIADLAASPVTQAEYVRRLRESAVAFNNPAVHACLGWKLGEYLALGKAIITTDVDAALPAPLVHGQHWHVTDGSPESIQDAVAMVCTNDDYRHKLERGARDYFESFVAPDVAVRSLVDCQHG